MQYRRPHSLNFGLKLLGTAIFGFMSMPRSKKWMFPKGPVKKLVGHKCASWTCAGSIPGVQMCAKCIWQACWVQDPRNNAECPQLRWGSELPGGDISSQFCENCQFSKLGGYKTFQALAIAKSGDFQRFPEIQSKNDIFVRFQIEIAPRDLWILIVFLQWFLSRKYWNHLL